MTRTFDDIRIDDGELPGLSCGGSLGDRAHALLAQQRAAWDLARRGYESLSEVRVRGVEVGPYPVRVRYSPGRWRSSSAQVDARSIEARPCFLCAANLPEGQRAVGFGAGYALLVNPFPIAPEHFTVPALRHQPQRIAASLPDLLALARELGPRYTPFYNGPRCGASAPDHLHFQAIPAGFLPLDGEFEALRAACGEVLGERDGVRVSALDRLPCRCIALESDEAEPLARAAGRFLGLLERGDEDGDEPMVNLVARHDGVWRLIVIPRARHRPSFYDPEGAAGFLLSPASVDLGGVCITPREEDYQRLEAGHLETMFDEVCLPADDLRRAAEALT